MLGAGPAETRYELVVDKTRTAEVLLTAGVKDPKKFVSEADKERLRLLRGEVSVLQGRIAYPRSASAPRARAPPVPLPPRPSHQGPSRT